MNDSGFEWDTKKGYQSHNKKDIITSHLSPEVKNPLCAATNMGDIIPCNNATR